MMRVAHSKDGHEDNVLSADSVAAVKTETANRMVSYLFHKRQSDLLSRYQVIKYASPSQPQEVVCQV